MAFLDRVPSLKVLQGWKKSGNQTRWQGCRELGREWIQYLFQEYRANKGGWGPESSMGPSLSSCPGSATICTILLWLPPFPAVRAHLICEGCKAEARGPPPDTGLWLRTGCGKQQHKGRGVTAKLSSAAPHQCDVDCIFM